MSRSRETAKIAMQLAFAFADADAARASARLTDRAEICRFHRGFYGDAQERDHDFVRVGKVLVDDRLLDFHAW